MKKIKLLVFEVDGGLTDNTVWMGRSGTEFKRFNIADGMGVCIARRVGMARRDIPIGRLFRIPISIDYSWFLLFAFLNWLLADG